MKIERAVREQTFTLTSIAGPSGSGKTYSALLYARGLVGPEGKVGFIDTENKRSRFYADVAGGFDVIDLDPPFTSQRYIEAIRALEKAGYGAIVIDSISHEWEGTGGVLEQAEQIEQATKRAGLHCWQKPKAGHKKLMNELLQTKAHLIFCCRVKEKVVQVKGQNGKTEIVNEGFVVVQEKSFIYEMTVSMMLSEGDHVPTIQKCPGDLEDGFARGKPITVDAGGAVRQWSEQGREIDYELEANKREGLEAANHGMKALMDWWKGLGKRQAKLGGLKDTFKSIATAADQMMQDAHDAGGGDPGERLRTARQSTETATSDGEGFDREKVASATKSLSTTPNSDSDPTLSDEAGNSSQAPADQDGDDESSTSSPSDLSDEAPPADTSWTPAERQLLIECCDKLIEVATDPENTPEQRRGILVRTKDIWKEELPAKHHPKLKQFFEYSDDLIKGTKKRADVVKFFASMLECSVRELGGVDG